jgi:hypothetical protein
VIRRASVLVPLAAPLCVPDAAAAHGLTGRTDLPIPEWLFAWAAASVLIVSFFALSMLWKTTKLESAPVRLLLTLPRWLDATCGVVGVAAFVFVAYAGFAGPQTPIENPLPIVVYVLFWVGLVPLSAVFGDVFRPFNPWRAIGRACGWIGHRVAPEQAAAQLPYPEWLGRWPAVAGLTVFGWLELIASRGDQPRTLAAAALIYAALQLIGMGLFGVRSWTDRGDAFSVYFGLFARISPLTVEGRRLGLRRPLSGLTSIEWRPGTVALVCAAVGITAFDGVLSGSTWDSITAWPYDALVGIGVNRLLTIQLLFSLGLLAIIALVAAVYRFGIEGVRTVDTRYSVRQLARAFGHSLVPIALAYSVAHYFSLIVFQGQAMFSLISDPLGRGSDLFGTVDRGIDYSAVSATLIWYVQVGALVGGHVAALIAAHDRGIALFDDARLAVRSQYWMLGVMVGFTSFGLWLLSEGNG